MKLGRVGPPGGERPVVLVSEEITPHTQFVDVSDLVPDFDAGFFEQGGPASIERAVGDRIARGLCSELGVERIGPPIARPHQILCVGLNYAEHAAEARMDLPNEPVVFTKAPNSISGPFDPVVVPPGATKLDYEVELGVVIGRRCSNLSDLSEAVAAVAGFTLVNDVSERAWQLEHNGQWLKGKSAATFNPCGPILVTKDEVRDCMDLAIWLEVNGQRRQSSSTASMIFGPFEIVRYLSRFMTLEPGDLIDTGTPSGVALGMDPPAYLQVGDELRLGIAGLSEQRYRIAAMKDAKVGAEQFT